MLGKLLGCDGKHQHPFSELLPLFCPPLSCFGPWALTPSSWAQNPRTAGISSFQLLPDLIQKPALFSQTGSPLGDFWGCYGSKIDNSHLKRQFSVAEDDQQHPSRPYPIGAGLNDHHSCSDVFFTGPPGSLLSLGPSQPVGSE